MPTHDPHYHDDPQAPLADSPGYEVTDVNVNGIVVFLASLAGCVWLIVASMRHADIPVETTHTVFGVPDDSHAEGDASR